LHRGRRRIWCILRNQFRALESENGVRGGIWVELESYHGTECDKANKGVGWDETETDDESIAESFEILIVETRVHDEEEYWWYLGWTGEGVLDSGVFWQKLGWEIGV
jgi:hypothetical protein